MIERNIQGVNDFLLDQVEKIDSSELEIEKRVNLMTKLIAQVHKGVSLELAYKKMLIQAPDVTKNRDIVVPLGKTALVDKSKDKVAG